MSTNLARLPRPAFAVQTMGELRLLADKAAEWKTVEDFYSSTYLGDMAPAFEEASWRGVKQLRLVSEERYDLKRPFELTKGTMALVADGTKMTELRLLGANDYHGIIGSPNSMAYNFWPEGILFTKEQASTKGAIFKLQNVYKWGFNRCRVYGENKVWRVLELISASNGTSIDIDVEDILERAVYMSGGPAAAGTPGGWVIDNLLERWYTIGAMTNPADPANDGLLYGEDCCQAIWAVNWKVAKSKGYAFLFKGTTANRGINTLNLIFNPNVEATFDKSGIAKLDNVAGCQIGGPASWSTAKGMPAIHLTENCQDCIVADIQAGLAGGFDGVEDHGVQNTIRDMEFVGYDAASNARSRGVSLYGSNAVVRNIKAAQMLNAVAAGSDPTNAGHAIQNVTGVSLVGRIIAGFDGPGTTRIEGITDLNSSGYMAAAASLKVPDGQDDLILSSPAAVTIWRLDGGPKGRIITLFPGDAGISVGDRFDASAPAGANVQLATAEPWTAPIKGGAIRSTLTLKQIGNVWKEIARN